MTSGHRAKAGYSLVEILVVLLVIGLMTSIAYLTFRPHQDSAVAAANDLQLDLARARTVSITQGRVVGIQVFPDGYRFVAYANGQWQRLDDSRQLNGRDLENGLTLRLVGQVGADGLEADHVWPDYWFDPTGMNEAATFWMESSDRRIRIELGDLNGIRIVEVN